MVVVAVEVEGVSRALAQAGAMQPVGQWAVHGPIGCPTIGLGAVSRVAQAYEHVTSDVWRFSR